MLGAPQLIMQPVPHSPLISARHAPRDRSEAELSSLQSTPSGLSASSRRILDYRRGSDGPASERLYVQGLRQRSERERVAEAAAAQQGPEATFAPTVSAESSRLVAEGRRLYDDGVCSPL